MAITAPLDLRKFQTKNIDEGVVRLLIEDSPDKYQMGPAIPVSGVQDGPTTLDIDSAENKTEGVICALYGRIMKGSTSLTIGKFPLEGLKTIVGAELVENAGVNVWMRVRKVSQLPYLAAEYVSKFIAGLEGQARARVIHHRMKCSAFSFTIGQDGFATVEMEFMSEFTRYPMGDGTGELLAIGGELISTGVQDSQAYLPTRQILPLWAPTDESGGWSESASTGYWRFYPYFTAIVGEYKEWDLVLSAGVHTIDFRVREHTSTGIFEVKLNGDRVGEIDTSAPADNRRAKRSLSFSVPEGGMHTLRVELITANTSFISDIELRSPVSGGLNTLPALTRKKAPIPASQFSGSLGAISAISTVNDGPEHIEQASQADYLEYSATLQPGNYKLEASLAEGPDYGIVGAYIDGVYLNQLNRYAASSADPTLQEFGTTFTVVSTRRVTAQLLASSKDSLSSGYRKGVGWVRFVRVLDSGGDLSGDVGPTETELHPMFADDSTGWTQDEFTTDLGRERSTSDSTAGRSMSWNDVLLLKGTYRARLIGIKQNGKPTLELDIGGSAVATFGMDSGGSQESNARIEDTFEVTETASVTVTLTNPAANAVSINYLYLEKIS